MILEKYRSLNDENNNDDGKYKMYYHHINTS